MKNLKVFTTLLIASIIFACSSDDDILTPETTITVKDFEITIDENPAPGKELGTIQVIADQGELTYSITSEEPTSAFAIDNAGKLTVNDATLFDYETRTILTAIVSVKNGKVTKEAKIIVNLNDVNDAIIIGKDFEITIDENPTPGKELGTIEATADQGKLTYSITNEEPIGAFAIDDTGKLTVKNATLFDYETRTNLTATILIKNGEINKETKVTVTLNDVNDSNIIINDFETTISENPTAGQELGTVEASTDQGTLTYSLKNESPTGAFTIDNTGKLTVKNASLFDYETRTKLTAIVSVNNGALSKEANIVVSLNDIIDPNIVIKDFETTISENPTAGQGLGTVEASTDQGTLTYSLKNESPTGAFTIDNTGKLTVKNVSLFDYETRTKLTAIVSVNNGVSSKEANIIVNLNNVIENIVFADSNFKKALVEHTNPVIDTNNDGEISIQEALVVEEIIIMNKSISNLSGIEYFTGLKVLNCGSNTLSSIDISKNTVLTNLACSSNQLTSLDVSKNTALRILICESNKLTSLDLSKNTVLLDLFASTNQLTSLNLKNGNNEGIRRVYAVYNSSLTCIQVDDPAASYLTKWVKDETASYSSNCTP